MKIVFTHGYFLREDAREQKIMRPYPPLGILYLSAWLEKHEMDNEVFDTTFSSRADLLFHLEKEPPDILAVYTNLMTKLNVIEIMRFVKSHPILKHTLIVLGGPDVTYNDEQYLLAGADVVVIGEGEQTMLEIAQTIKKGAFRDFAHINGLAYLDDKKNLLRTPPRQRIRPIDQLPLPNRKKIDLEKYLEVWEKHHGKRTLSVSTQRGCPYTCKWCSTAVYGQSYRRRSPQKVVDELVFLKKNYNPDLIWFVDDVFTVSHKWLQNFRDELKLRNICIPFECITRADRLNPDVIQILKDCGCFRVWIGAESGSQKIIDAMDRRVEVTQVREMIREVRYQNIEAGTFIMLGYPGETEKDILETINHLKYSNPDLFTITIAYPIKGTGLYESVKDKKITASPWISSTDRDIDFVRTYPRPYYDYAVRWVVNAVNLHKHRLRNKGKQLSDIPFALKIAAARAGMFWYKYFKKTPSKNGISG